MVAALNFGENGFIYTAGASTIKGPDVIEFLHDKYTQLKTIWLDLNDDEADEV
ncbi:hypothetical protein [Paraburkholderia sp. HD33-4]|uniref:hypothetical protein n=1 Tax=Paraburkholderia sp. HD33-4 TaxID=2883242 RepID=UPI001F19E19C|nr:hypothetical protein [Paraburkholderia sp. HD33-4]